MKTFIIATLLMIKYVSASLLVADDAELLSRDERSKGSDWQENKPSSHGGCYEGQYTIDTTMNGIPVYQCINCPPGTFNTRRGFYKHCVTCPGNEMSEEGSSRCSPECELGSGWNRTTLKCSPCEKGMYNDQRGLTSCKQCPKYHRSLRKAEKCSLDCPKGFEPKELEDGSSTCSPCPFGMYNKIAGKMDDNKPCLSCCGETPDCTKNWTLSTGTEKKQCFQLPVDAAICYPKLVLALQKAAHHVREDDDHSERLFKAFCRSGIDLDALKKDYFDCKETTVKVSGEEKMSVPSLKIGENQTLEYTHVFIPGQLLSCKTVEDDRRPEYLSKSDDYSSFSYRSSSFGFSYDYSSSSYPSSSLSLSSGYYSSSSYPSSSLSFSSGYYSSSSYPSSSFSFSSGYYSSSSYPSSSFSFSSGYYSSSSYPSSSFSFSSGYHSSSSFPSSSFSFSSGYYSSSSYPSSSLSFSSGYYSSSSYPSSSFSFSSGYYSSSSYPSSSFSFSSGYYSSSSYPSSSFSFSSGYYSSSGYPSSSMSFSSGYSSSSSYSGSSFSFYKR